MIVSLIYETEPPVVKKVLKLLQKNPKEFRPALSSVHSE
jgi:hypothetical protein